MLQTYIGNTKINKLYKGSDLWCNWIGTDGLTTQIRVNGTTYTQSNGLITLPDYPSASSYNIWVGTQTEYDAISTKDNNTLYFIKEG